MIWVFLEPIITEGLLMFRGKEERFYIPGQEIQVQFSKPFVKAAKKFRLIHTKNFFNVNKIGNGETHQEGNIVNIAPFFPLSIQNGHHLLGQEYLGRRRQDLPVNGKFVQENFLRLVESFLRLAVDTDQDLSPRIGG